MVNLRSNFRPLREPSSSLPHLGPTKDYPNTKLLTNVLDLAYHALTPANLVDHKSTAYLSWTFPVQFARLPAIMPTIPIHPPSTHRSGSSASALPQLLQTPSGYAIVEIQGTVNTSRTNDNANAMGKIVFPHYEPGMANEDTSWHKRVYLYVGKHQRLTGEVKKLAKPLAVIRKVAGTGNESAPEELEIAEIVYWKVLFAHRPEPVGGE